MTTICTIDQEPSAKVKREILSSEKKRLIKSQEGSEKEKCKNPVLLI
jgi:hypothetical protein